VEVVPTGGTEERHQLYTLNPSHPSGSGTLSGSESAATYKSPPPTYDNSSGGMQLGIIINNTTTQALVNDPTSPTHQVGSITNVIQPNSPPGGHKDKYNSQRPQRIGGIASLAEPTTTSTAATTVIPMSLR
jgi:hypothetical protein